ncbi:MAG: hypothetical protein ACLFT0_17855 [Spirulinaceae cyanobacterium]
MMISQKQSFTQTYAFAWIKSFLIWSFTLTVCLLVVGFPVVFLMATIGALAAIVLQSVLPVSAVLLVAGSILSANLLGILLGAVMLTAKGIHPQEVSWLNWLHGENRKPKAAIYAACPLTCGLIS